MSLKHKSASDYYSPFDLCTYLTSMMYLNLVFVFVTRPTKTCFFLCEPMNTFFFLKKKWIFFLQMQITKRRMSRKRKCMGFLDCWLFDVNDIASVVFNFLHDFQLEYWITQSTQHTEIEMLIRNVCVLQPHTLLHLMKTNGSRTLLEKADRKTALHTISKHGGWCMFLLDAPIWWIQLHRHEIRPNNVYTIFSELSSDRARDLVNVFAIGSSWSKKKQANLFIDACYSADDDDDDINGLSWLWDHCCLQDYTLQIDFAALCVKVVEFVLQHCTLVEWDRHTNSSRLPLTHVKLLETKWQHQMPTITDALRSRNFDVAVHTRSKLNSNDFANNYFANIDGLLLPTQMTKDHIHIVWKVKQCQQHDIVFANDRNFNCQPFQEEPRLPQRQEQRYGDLDFLVRSVVARLEPDSLLHKDTIRWLDGCLRQHCCDAYFWQACKLKLGALVTFLWNNVDDGKRATWVEYLSFCFPSWDNELLLFVQAQSPQLVMDNADVFAHRALQMDGNITCWRFCLPLLSPREVYRLCQLSMEYHLRFFIAAWPYVEHRHANALFDLALARRRRGIAIFLLEQPELKLDHLGDRLPVFIEMCLSDAISRIPYYKHFSEAQVMWCAKHALEKYDAKTLSALYPLLPLTKEQWRKILMDVNLKPIKSDFAKVLLQCELVTGCELFGINQIRFLDVLDVVHFDI